MHLYVIVRGVEKYVRRWREDLEMEFFPFQFEKGKPGFIQLGVRPIQLYEVVFPAGYETEVLKRIGCGKYEKYSWLQRSLKVMAKMLGLKPVSGVDNARPFPYVHVYPIGLKKDEFKNGIEQL